MVNHLPKQCLSTEDGSVQNIRASVVKFWNSEKNCFFLKSALKYSKWDGRHSINHRSPTGVSRHTSVSLEGF